MNVETLFSSAIKLLPSERTAFLEANCNGDAELRRRVEQLLAEHDHPDSLFDRTELHVDANPAAKYNLPPRLGDFEIGKELGRGGMGVVFEARQTSLKRRVALKVLSSSLGLSSRAIVRFRREAEAAAKLHHTNIVPIYSTGEHQGVHYYAMEIIDGPALDRVISELKEQAIGRQALASGSPLSDRPGNDPETQAPFRTEKGEAPTSSSSEPVTGAPRLIDSASGISSSSGAGYFDNIATLMAGVADALDHAHEHGVIHRDIKPSNLLLGPDGRLSVNDFGLARVLEQPGMTVSGEFVGTPRYMSPEQITAGRAPLDHRTDIYSLGATLYELLTLEPPFPGSTRDEVIAQILYKDPKPPHRINRKIPRDLETICLKSLERDPDRRYQTARHLADDLRAFVNRHAISARRIGPIGKTIRWVKRNPSWTALALAVLLLISGVSWKLKSDQLARRASFQDKADLAIMTGDFDAAQDWIDQAEVNGALDSWLLMARGKIEVFKGNFNDAEPYLLEASKKDAPVIPVTALYALANLFGGDELEFAKQIKSVNDRLANKTLVPRTAEDQLYLGMLYMWDDPRRALEFLEDAEREHLTGRLLHLVRSNANTRAAMIETNDERSQDFANAAVSNAEALGLFKGDSRFALARYIDALTVQATCYGLRDQEEQSISTFAKAYDALEEVQFPSENADLNFAKYILLDQSGKSDEALSFLMTLTGEQTDGYLLTYRMLEQIAGKEILQAKVDMQSPQHEDRFKVPILVLVQLAHTQNEDERKVLATDFRSEFQIRMQKGRDIVHHVEFSWAICKLLNMNEEEIICVKIMRDLKQDYSGTYMDDLMDPILAVVDDESEARLEELARRSRRSLSYTCFARAIDALTRNNRQEARIQLERCAKHGYYRFFVTRFSKVLLKRWESEPTWPEWIEPTESSKP